MWERRERARLGWDRLRQVKVGRERGRLDLVVAGKIHASTRETGDAWPAGKA